jgi:hypothetical protein
MGLHFAETLTTKKMQMNPKSFNGGKLFVLKFIATIDKCRSEWSNLPSSGFREEPSSWTRVLSEVSNYIDGKSNSSDISLYACSTSGSSLMLGVQIAPW